MGVMTSCDDENNSQWDMDHPEGWNEEQRGDSRVLYPANLADGSTYVVERIDNLKSGYFSETDFKSFLSDEIFEKDGFKPVSEIVAGRDDFLNYKYHREFETADGRKGIRALGFAKDKAIYVEGYGTDETYPEIVSIVESLRLAGGVSPNDYFLKNFNNFILLVLFVITISDGFFMCESIKMRKERPSDRKYYNKAIKVGSIVFAAVTVAFIIILWPCPELMWKYVLINAVIFGLFVAFGLTVFMRKFVESLVG